jgi:predicted permease
MPFLRRLSNLWHNLFRKSRKEQALAEEIEVYLEMLVEQKINEGLDTAEARRAALIELGGKEQVKEKVRDVSIGHQLETLWQDLSYGLRMFGRNPGFTAVAVLSLGLGIGANTAVFSVMDAVLLKMLPVKYPEQLYIIEREGATPVTKISRELPSPFFEQLRAQHELLAGVCTFFDINSRVDTQVMVDGQAEFVRGQAVSVSFFEVLGVNALLGRTITEEDEKGGGQPVVVISYNYWQGRFARDPAIIGKTIIMNGHPFTIIGVTPPDFFGVMVGDAPDLWRPVSSGYVAYTMARLMPEVTEEQASTVLTGLLRQSLTAESVSHIPAEEQQSVSRQSIVLIPASHGFRGFSDLRARFSEPLRILMAMVGLVLLIACANVANLLLARATARRKEIAVRLALGAGRLRLIRQLLTESMLLAVAGGLLGMLLAQWGGSFLLVLVGSGRDPIFLKLTLDLRALGFTAGASLLAGILFGLAPAWRATRVDLTPALKDGGRRSGSGARLGLGKALVGAQVALSLSLLIGAGLFVRSLEKLKSLDAGFNRENLLLVSTEPAMAGYKDKQVPDLYQRIRERITSIPGVRFASFSREGLLSRWRNASRGSVHLRGQPVRPHENTVKGMPSNTTPFCQVGPEYFETLGMTILRGRGFNTQEIEKASYVTVVNETFARHYFGGEDPLGQHFSFAPGRGGWEIVGVVKDAKYNDLREHAMPTYYIPYRQEESWREMTFQIRTAVEPTQIIKAVRQAVREVDPNLPLFNVKTLTTQVDETIVQERLIGTLSSFFGLASLLLAAIGLYGILAYSVNQRTHEIGIRMTLGAQRSEVLRMVLKQGMTLVSIGLVLGLAVSFATTRIVASYLFGITPTDPVTFIGAPLLMLMVALLACFVPARRATKVDPLVALRYE